MRPLVWMRAVRDAKLGTSRSVVLISVALRVRRDGTARVTAQQLAKDASVSERAVVEHLVWAVEAGYLIKDTEGYRLNRPDGAS